MPIQITAMIQGHPWDLWGLSRIFDGSNATQTLVTATEPKGKPTFDASDRESINRFRIMGYDVHANVTSAELLWADGRVDLRDARPIAENLMDRINGIAMLLDPEYRAAKLVSISYKSRDGGGGSVFGDWTPNKDMTSLGRHSAQQIFANDILTQAREDRLVKFVLDAIALPRTWASLYLIYDAIAGDVGGVQQLMAIGWVDPELLSDFTNSANNSRSVSEGARHGKRPQTDRPLIPLIQGYEIVNRLAMNWMDWVRRGRE